MLRLFITLFMLLALPFCAQGEAVQIQHNGLHLNAEYNQVNADLNAPVVLLTHGTLAYNGMEIIESFSGLLNEAGYNTLSITLSLGLDDRHGMYDCAVPHTHRHTDAMDEIGLWVGWLKHKGVKHIVLLGHSRGGNQTAWYAAEHAAPEIDKVVLVAPMTWSANKQAQDYAKSYHTELAPVYAKAKALVDAGIGDTPMRRVGFIYCKDAVVSAAAFENYYRNEPRFDTPSLLDAIKVPVLIITGSADTTVADVAAKVAALGPSERRRLLVIDGADHFFRDLYADDAIAAVDEFIQE